MLTLNLIQGIQHLKQTLKQVQGDTFSRFLNSYVGVFVIMSIPALQQSGELARI